MTKIPKAPVADDYAKQESNEFGIISVNNRKSNYKSQKPILEKRRRDRINSSLDELKSLLLAIKQRDPLRYARLEKADILEMVVKHLKDIKKRRQAMVAAMEPILFRSFKMGFMDCTRATIDFINEIESPGDKKKQIIEHITQECLKTFHNRCPPTSFTQHHEIAFANVNPSEQFMAFPLLSTSLDGEMEWPSLEERLGFSPIGKNSFLLPDVKPLPELMSSSLLKIAEPRTSAFIAVNKSSDLSLESPSTSGTSVTVDETTPQRSVFVMNCDTSDDDDNEDDNERKLIIDDQNNNRMTNCWRPWTC